jgi:hypothetical protein
MKHPNQATLALHAGGDLGFFARWRTERHLAKCELCREEVAAFDGMREIVTDLSEMPEIQWNRLAAEMKANIRLGLEAGECVRTGDRPLRETPLFTGFRAAVAFTSIVALVVTGVALERSNPVRTDDRTVVQNTADGIQVGSGEQVFRLMNTGATNVTISVGAQGSMGARYVDPKTGYVTINNVYAE